MLFAFGMPSTGSLILISVIVLVLFFINRRRSRGVKWEGFDKKTLH